MTPEERKESSAFVEGREACLGGACDCDNPYKIGTDDAMDWQDGFSSVDDCDAD